MNCETIEGQLGQSATLLNVTMTIERPSGRNERDPPASVHRLGEYVLQLVEKLCALE